MCSIENCPPPSLQIKRKAVTTALQSARVRLFLILLSCLGELGERNRCTQQHFWLHPATAITVHSDTNAPWGDSYWHYTGRPEERDTNSRAWQAKFSWAITAKVRVIFILKAKYYHCELSCLLLEVHSPKIIWKKINQSQTTLIPPLPIFPFTQGSLNSPGQWNHTNSHFSGALEPSRGMRKFIRRL